VAVVIALALLAAVVGVAVLATGGHDERSSGDPASTEPSYDTGDEEASTYDPIDDTTTYDDSTSEEDIYDTTTYDPGVEDTTEVEPPDDAVRYATLFSTDAKVRSAPALDAPEAGRFTDQEGMGFDVLAEADPNGWYRVRIDGTEGYMFGSFVLPPSPGYCVAESYADDGAPMFDGGGTPLAGEKTGNRILIEQLFSGDGRYGVLLPGGQRGYVWDTDVNIVGGDC
jgi:hypothetical protein